MPRLLHIMDYVPQGNRTFDHFILTLTSVFRERGWEVLFAFAAEPPAKFAEEMDRAGARWVAIQFPFTHRSARRLRQSLKGCRPDVTQTSFVSVFNRALLSWKLFGFTRRLVVIDHSSGLVASRSGLKRVLTKLRGWAAGKVVDAIVPVSNAIARRDIDCLFLPWQKVEVNHNGVLLDRFSNPPRATGGALRIVYAGQLIPEKGVMTLLRACERLQRAGGLGAELLIAGKGAQEAELKNFCHNAGLRGVQFLGHLDSIPALFSTADVVVVPSEWFEAFGNVAAEAMACGAACLVSDAGGLPEVVGDAGRVFKAGDEVELAARLKELLEEPATRSRLGAAGRARVAEVFTLERKVGKQFAICEAVLQRMPIARAQRT